MVVKLDEKAKEAIEAALSKSKGAEIAIRNGKIVVWETTTKKTYETAITDR